MGGCARGAGVAWWTRGGRGEAGAHKGRLDVEKGGRGDAGTHKGRPYMEKTAGDAGMTGVRERGTEVGRGVRCVQSMRPMCSVFRRMCSVFGPMCSRSSRMCSFLRARCSVEEGKRVAGREVRPEKRGRGTKTGSGSFGRHRAGFGDAPGDRRSQAARSLGHPAPRTGWARRRGHPQGAPLHGENGRGRRDDGDVSTLPGQCVQFRA